MSLDIAMIRFWVRTNVYYIQLDQTARFDSFLTSMTLIWPLMTLYGLIWPQIIWISILGKILSRNVCILNIFRLIRPFWPKFDLRWPLTGHDIYAFEISKRIPIFWGICHHWSTRWRSRVSFVFLFILLQSASTLLPHLVCRSPKTSDQALSDDVWFIRLTSLMTSQSKCNLLRLLLFSWVPPTQMTTYDQRSGMKMISWIWRVLWSIN